MSARDRILARLKASAPAQPLPLPGLPPANPGLLSGDLLDAGLPRFITMLEAMHAEMLDLRGHDRATEVALLKNFCKSKTVQRLLIPVGLDISGDETLHVELFDRPIDEIKDALFRDIDAGLTVADCGIADTGLLLMRSSPRQPRSLSLVPPIHFCVINVNRLYSDLRGALAGERWGEGTLGNMPTNLVFISGPSKTADIQQTLAYGAHGPKELIVVLTDRDWLENV